MKPDIPPFVAECEKETKSNESRDIVAEKVGVAPRYVSDAKRQGLAIEHSVRAHSIEVNAQRKLGLMLADTERAKGSAGRGNPDWLGSTQVEPPSNEQPTLAELGIQKKVSTKSQKLASLP